MENAFLNADRDTDSVTVSLKGDWVFGNVQDLESALADVDASGASAVTFQCGGLQNIDIAGAWVLFRKSQNFETTGCDTDFRGFKAAHFKFLKNVTQAGGSSIATDHEAAPRVPRQRAQDALESLGKAATSGLQDIGFIAMTILQGITKPSKLAVRETVRQVYQTGVQAIPIISLISFLMGVVVAYQGANQLAKFGADIFVVDLVTISILREMGVIMAAIMVAGRSGSAFAASLGVMKLNEELDALRVMGLNPNQVLVAPRLIGLIIALPLLTVFADLAGLAGGLFLSVTLLDISAVQFIDRAANSADLTTLFVGLVKAPVFAFLIGAVGTLRGLQVTSSAEQLGRLTTTAVVQAIALIIAADAVFTIIFIRLGI
ncbi:MAG: ABC transporter permease [Gammaproteobacteria bacterium]|nr:ABC transporter permease [Gammaproteobacteria bacterium]